jgi:diaminohydroxyphosphoribosylaminopyrimidine deaminase/5-amino-6-(5-phosphoribosylamino)uracil reductase
VQRLRAESCAVVTGVNTLLYDDPSLNVRAAAQGSSAELSALRQPRRVILDSALRTPATARLLQLPGDVLVLTASAETQRLAGVEVRQLAAGSGGRVDLQAAMQCLAKDYPCNEVLLEAGPTLSGAMVQAGLVDEVIIYIGAKFLGSDAMPLLRLSGLQHMADQIALDIVDATTIDGDLRVTARLRSA